MWFPNNEIRPLVSHLSPRLGFCCGLRVKLPSQYTCMAPELKAFRINCNDRRSAYRGMVWTTYGRNKQKRMKEFGQTHPSLPPLHTPPHTPHCSRGRAYMIPIWEMVLPILSCPWKAYISQMERVFSYHLIWKIYENLSPFTRLIPIMTLITQK